MADSSSKEAFRALGAFLAAYMQGKQNEKDRASKDHWEQVHYELAKQQLEVSEKNAAASNAMQKARYGLDKQKFDAEKLLQDQSLGRQMDAAKAMGAASPEEFAMRLQQENADTMKAYREGGGFGGDKGQFTALSTAIDDSRYEMGQVQSRMSSLQKLMSDPMTDDATKQAAIAELAQLDTRYKSLDVEMTNLKARRANMMGLGAAPSQPQDDSISQSGAAQQPKETTKGAEKPSGMSSRAQTLSNAFRAAGEIYSQPFTGPRTAAGKPMKDGIGFNMGKALKSGNVTDQQLRPFVKKGQKFIPKGQFNDRKILDTGEALPLIDVTDPLGLGIGLGEAGAVAGGLSYLFRKQLGAAGRSLAKKAGEKGAKKAASKAESELKNWQPDWDLADLEQFMSKASPNGPLALPGGVIHMGESASKAGGYAVKEAPLKPGDSIYAEMDRLSDALRRAPVHPSNMPRALPAPAKQGMMFGSDAAIPMGAPSFVPTGTVPYDIPVNPIDIEHLRALYEMGRIR